MASEATDTFKTMRFHEMEIDDRVLKVKLFSHFKYFQIFILISINKLWNSSLVGYCQAWMGGTDCNSRKGYTFVT